MPKLTPFTNNYGSRHKAEGGYIALLSVIVTGAVIMTLIASLSAQAGVNRSITLDREFKEQSRQLASGCAAEAVLKFALNNTYQGNENLVINAQHCVIKSLAILDSTKIVVVTTAVVADLVTTYQTSFNRNDLSVISQMEIINN